MRQKLFKLILSITLLASCSNNENNPLRKCLGADIVTKMELIDSSFEISLKYNGLEDIDSFLKLVVNNGGELQFDIPEKARLSNADIKVLNSILMTEEQSYSQSNKLVACVKKYSTTENNLTTKYLAVKESVGNISPIIMADGFLNSGQLKDFNDKLVRDLILIEVYLPILKKAIVGNGR